MRLEQNNQTRVLARREEAEAISTGDSEQQVTQQRGSRMGPTGRTPWWQQQSPGAGMLRGYHRDALWAPQGCDLDTAGVLRGHHKALAGSIAPGGGRRGGGRKKQESQESDYEQNNTTRGRACGERASRAIFTQRKLQLICEGSGLALGNPAGRPRTRGRTVHYFLI